MPLLPHETSSVVSRSKCSMQVLRKKWYIFAFVVCVTTIQTNGFDLRKDADLDIRKNDVPERQGKCKQAG